MAKDKPVTVVLELSTILAGNTRDWTLLTEGGNCCVPEVVIEELNFLTRKGIYDNEEKIAREFARFFPESHWQIITEMSPHPILTAKEGQNLSKKARLLQSVAECTHHLAIKKSQEKIIIVTNEGNLKNDLINLNLSNLEILTLAQYRRWIREKEMSSDGVSVSQPNKENTGKNYQVKYKKKTNTSYLKILGTSVTMIFSLILIVSLGLYFVSPQSLENFLQKLGFSISLTETENQN